MWVSSLDVSNFRNYEHAQISLTPGATLFFGENGEGKTNLLEAIHFASTMESHRVAGYQSLIRDKSPSSQLALKVNSAGRELLVGFELNREKTNRYFLNGNQIRKNHEILGLVSSVLFAPEDLDLVRRDPSDRRAFLDDAVIQLKPRMASVKQDYDRVLKQRNALLKSARSVKNPELTTLDIWDDQLVRLGVEIIVQRLALIELLRPQLEDFYQKLSNKHEEINLKLVSAIGEDEDLSELPTNPKELAELFIQKLRQLRKRELERGITLVGPHRDELLILKDQLPARSHASQGEAWSLALGLKLALAHLLRESSNIGDPVLLLDDVFAVLDVGRRARLLEFVLGFEQVIVTAADKAMAPEINWANTYEVSGGEVRSEN